MQRDDAGGGAAAETGDRCRSGRRHRSRLPAGGELRSRRRIRSRHFRHPGGRHRPVLLDADGGAVAQRAAQARHAHAADRRTGVGDARPRTGTGQQRGRSRHRAGRRDRTGPQHRQKIRAHGENRQGGVLSPGRDAARRSLSLCRRGDDPQHAGTRCRGRHQRVHREARSDMGGPVIFRAIPKVRRE